MANLRPWKKGQVPNPEGRNQYTGRNAFLAQLEKELLGDQDPDHPGAAVELARMLIDHARGLAGKDWEIKQARELVMPRLLPDPKVQVELGGEVKITAEDRAEAQKRLEKLMERKAS